MAKDKTVRVGDVDERGRLVRDDVPDDARRSARKGKKRKDTRKEQLASLSDEPQPKKKKKKVLEFEEVPEKKRKKKAKLDNPATDKAIAKLERRREKFENDLEYLPAVSGGDEFDNQYRSMFDNLQHITSLFEDKMMDNPTGRDVYALSTLYSQMREVIADIRSSKDVSQQIVELESKAYSAFIQLVGQSYVDLYFKMQKEIRASVKNLDEQEQLLTVLKGVCKDQGDTVQEGYRSMLERVRTVLV